jgi:YhcH/YjgK/YiaL family protein
MSIVTITNKTIQSQFIPQPDQSINLEQAAEHFEKFHERWNTAFTFLAGTDLKSLKLGRIDLSEDVFVLVSEYTTKNSDEAKYESHRKYIDLQYLLAGQELIGLTKPDELNVISPYSEENDVAFYEFNGGEFLSASPSNYFIFFPDDAHKPCVSVDSQTDVRKVVVKIKYNA